jgi:hypothetical protein
MRGFGWSALALSVVTAACNGFPDAIPFSEAEHKAEKYVTYTSAAAPALNPVGNQRFMVLPGAVVSMPASALMPVTDGSLLASRFDAAPFDALYQRGSDAFLRIAAEVR